MAYRHTPYATGAMTTLVTATTPTVAATVGSWYAA